MVWLMSAFVEWRERRQALREIQQLADAEQETLGYDDNNPVNLAKISLSLNDHGVALRHWRDAMTRFPSFAKTHKDALDIMIKLGLLDEAEAIMKENMRRFPTVAQHAGGFAQIAEEQRNFQEALVRWKGVVKKHPSWWKGYLHYAIALTAMGDGAAADNILASASARFPNEPTIGIEWARNADRRGDYEAALYRWRKVMEINKHSAAAPGIARALIGLGRLDEAEAYLQEARTRWPLVAEIRITFAHIAMKRGDTDEALRRWVELKTRMPLLRFGYEGELRLLRDLGRFDEAETVICEAKKRFPQESWPDAELQTNDRARQRHAQAAGQNA